MLRTRVWQCFSHHPHIVWVSCFILLLVVVYFGVRRLCGISVMPMMCVSSGCLWNLHGEDLFWEGHEITPEGIVHPNILIYDRVYRST